MTKWLIGILCLGLFAPLCPAQTVQPISQPHQSFLNVSGLPCSGCRLYSYVAGTTTPQATYTDSSGTTQNPNPVVLDASGSASIWMGASAYKFALLDTYGTTLWTVDNVLAPAPGGGGPYLPLAGGTLTGTVTGPVFNGTTITGTTVNAATLNGGTGIFSGNLTAQTNLLAQTNVVVGTEGTDGYVELLPATTGDSIFYIDNSGNALRVGNAAAGNVPLTYDHDGDLTIPAIFTAATVNAALNGTLGATSPSSVAGTTGTFSGAVQGAAITGSSVTASDLTPGNCVQAGTGGLLTAPNSACDTGYTKQGSGSGCAFASDGNGLTCTTVVTLGTPMPDTNYGAVCSPQFSTAIATTTSAMPSLGLGWIIISDDQIEIYEALNNGSSTGYSISSAYGVTIQCLARHQ